MLMYVATNVVIYIIDMYIYIAMYAATCYLYTDIIKSDLQEKIKYEESRLQKGLHCYIVIWYLKQKFWI